MPQVLFNPERVADTFLTHLNAGDFELLYELHSSEFQAAFTKAEAAKRYQEFRKLAGPCERSGEPKQGAQESEGRKLVVIRVLAQCKHGSFVQEFVLGSAQDSSRVSAFRWKKERA